MGDLPTSSGGAVHVMYARELLPSVFSGYPSSIQDL